MASNLSQATTDVNRLSELVDFFNKICLGGASDDATLDNQTRPVLAKLAASFLLGMDTYATVAEGLAGAGEGGFFQVVSDVDEEYTILYQDVNGVAVEKKRYPSYALHQLVLEARDRAEAAAQSAETSSDVASTARDQSVAASEASGDVQFFDTKSDADAAALAEGDIVEVFADESRGGGVARYRYESGSLVFKWQPGQRHVQAAGSTDTRTQQEWAALLLQPNSSEVTAEGKADQRALAAWMRALGYPNTSTGEQSLVEALDARAIYASSVAELVMVSSVEGQVAFVSGCPFIYTSGAWSPSAGYVTPMAYGAAGDNITDDTAAFQAATDAAGTVIVPSTPDGYYLAGFLQTSKPVNRFIGLGMPKIRAASKFSKVFHNDFYVEGLDIASDSNDYIVIGQPTSSAGLDNVKAHKCRFFGGFYAFRVGLEVTDPNTWRASNVSVTECYSEAPIGLNAGHFFCTKTDKVLYDNNEVKYGLNSSAYGTASCTRVTITNNRESETSDSVNDVEAAIQVEDSVDSQTIISGNECQHDIWVSSSENVLVFGNLSRELRVSIGNANAGGVDNTKFIGNTAGRIRLDKFAVNPPAVTYSARFISNTLKPGDYQKDGAFLDNALFINADDHCGEVTFSNNEVIPYNGTAVALSRTGENAVIKFYDNDLGKDGHSVSGSSGFFEERNNTNPIYLTKNGSIEAGLSVNISPTIGSWTDLVLTREGIDINREVNNLNGVITAAKAGFYEISGIFTVNTTTSIGVGLRVVRNLDGLEICRLFFLPTSGSGPNCTPLRSGRFYLNSGQEVKLQYFVTDAGATIESSAALTSIEINRD